MLASLVLELVAANAGRIQQTHGHHLRGAFYEILRTVEPESAEDLHDANMRKPFTLSNLHGLGKLRHHSYGVREGQECWVRVTLLDAELLQDFYTYFVIGGTTLRVGSVHFHLKTIHSSSQTHTAANMTTPDALAAQWQRPLSAADSTIALQFRTPTGFSTRDRRKVIVLPQPELVFGELARYWDALTGEATMEKVVAFSAENILISQHKITTVISVFGSVKQIGFKGRVEFELLPTENDWFIRHLNCLADLAFYTGLGARTGLAMGQVSRIR